MGGRVGVGDVAGDLGQDRARAAEAEARGRVVAGLDLQAGEIDALLEQPGRGPGLEPAQFQAQVPQAGAQVLGRGVAQAAAAEMGQAHMDEPAQEGAGGQEHGPGPVGLPQGRGHSGGPAVLLEHGHGHVLADPEVFPAEDVPADHPQVGVAVDLGPGGPHGRALAGVQDAELDARLVGPPAHVAAQGVDLPDHVALGQAADGRVAGKVPDALGVDGQEQGGQAQPGRGHGRLAPGVAGADHHQVEEGGRGTAHEWSRISPGAPGPSPWRR